MHLKPFKIPKTRTIFTSTILLALVLFAPLSQSLAQEGQSNRKAQIKIAFIYNFAKFTNWPDRSFDALPHNSFPICFIGKESLGNLFDQLAGTKIIQDKTILIQKNPSDRNLKNCRILYISSSESWRLENLLKTLEGHSVLTVANAEGFAERGVGINLFERNEKLAFEINRKAILKSDLTLSSELLSLGVLVDEENSHD